MAQQLAQQRLFEQLVRDRQTTNITSNISLNLESGSNRNPKAKSSIQCTLIPVDTQDEFHTSQVRDFR